MIKAALILVAAGRGHRAGAALPKQYVPLAGWPILRHTLNAFAQITEIETIIPVIHPDDEHLFEKCLMGFDDARLMPWVAGGATRSASVHQGLKALAADPPEYVLIHDAARPFVTHDVVKAVLAMLKRCEGACPALPVVDALWHSDAGTAYAPQNRDTLRRAQTPQGFHYARILAAYNQAAATMDDDVGIAQSAGLKVRFTPGDDLNIKITTPDDLIRAQSQLERRMEFRTGNGYDVHRFGEGDHITLCGVDIPFNRALQGHSDADVGMHAITDALFGALAEGDIGRWFPPSDQQWRGAASHIFLEKAVERVAERQGRIVHIDCTLVCEYPKIGPLADQMRAEIGRICSVALDRVSIKATTSERLGFTGRGEGIAALATATVSLP